MGKSVDTKRTPKSWQLNGPEIVVTIRQTLISLTQDIGEGLRKEFRVLSLFSEGLQSCSSTLYCLLACIVEKPAVTGARRWS